MSKKSDKRFVEAVNKFRIEKEPRSSVSNPKDLMNNKKENFLLELAELMEKYDVAVCSRSVAYHSSEVFFQFHKDGEIEELHTNRLHSTPYELRVIAKEIV